MRIIEGVPLFRQAKITLRPYLLRPLPRHVERRRGQIAKGDTLAATLFGVARRRCRYTSTPSPSIAFVRCSVSGETPYAAPNRG